MQGYPFQIPAAGVPYQPVNNLREREMQGYPFQFPAPAGGLYQPAAGVPYQPAAPGVPYDPSAPGMQYQPPAGGQYPAAAGGQGQYPAAAGGHHQPPAAGHNQPVIQHFSHQHPLHLTDLHDGGSPAAAATCACCRRIPSGWTYACATCKKKYYLHASCAQLPQSINHPAHPLHTLALLPLPATPDGCFDCSACRGSGTGFSYHCSPCGLAFHPLCAAAPPSATYKGHSHPLTLTFSLPPHYIMGGFTCDVCRTEGSSDCWLYRCARCEFDAHMRCATAAAAGGEDRRRRPPPGKTLAQLVRSRRGDDGRGYGYGVPSSPFGRHGSDDDETGGDEPSY